MSRFIAFALVGGLLLTACTDDTAPPLGTGGTAGLAAQLIAFGSCDDVAEWVRAEALEAVGPYGLDSGGGWFGPIAMGREGAAAEDDTADAEAGGVPAMAPPSDSGTNVQEAGVDEPDTAKLDGDTLVLVRERSLVTVDLGSGGPTVLAQTDIGIDGEHELLVRDGRGLIISREWGPMVPFEGDVRDDLSMPAPMVGTVLTPVDLSNPADPRLEASTRIQGTHVSARMVDDVIRVVVRTEPGPFDFLVPTRGSEAALAAAEAHNREVLASAPPEAFLPTMYRTDADGNPGPGEPLLGCDDLSRPAAFSGLGTLSVSTVDVTSGRIVDATGVLAGGDTVYAAPERLIVATTRWTPTPLPQGGDQGRDQGGDILPVPSGASTTELHSFDTTDPGATTYVASGEVEGRLLDQWGLSFHDGHLRAATTIGDAWGWRAEGAGEVSESVVTILAEQGDQLVVTGEVRGLGPDERIYAVRMMGDIGYVVTFRETDPLYTLDLSDPTAPRTIGELKIPGYSAYLHPLADGLLLGIGQDADDQGMSLGAQVSLFDVTDLAAPTRLATLDLGDGMSDVEWDHRAFTFDAATATAVVPVQTWGEPPTSGARLIAASRDGLAERAVVDHADLAGGASDPWEVVWRAGVRRSLVHDGALVTISDYGVKVLDLSSLADRGAASF